MHKLFSFIATLIAMSVIWLVFLPWLADRRAVRDHVDRLHAANINASAMFYSELDCLQTLP